MNKLEEKECSKCGENKNVDEYYNYSKAKLRIKAKKMPHCMECQKDMVSGKNRKKRRKTKPLIGLWWNVKEQPIRKVS